LTSGKIRVIIDLGTEPAWVAYTRVDFTEFRYCTIGARVISFCTEFWHCGAERADPHIKQSGRGDPSKLIDEKKVERIAKFYQ
jgi:hypothetical protein